METCALKSETDWIIIFGQKNYEALCYYQRTLLYHEKKFSETMFLDFLTFWNRKPFDTKNIAQENLYKKKERF